MPWWTGSSPRRSTPISGSSGSPRTWRTAQGKGYAVESTLPSALAGRGFARFNAEITEIGRTDDISDEPLKSFGTDEDGNHRVYQPNLTPLQAGPYLTREIGDALDDLECGREFYPVYKTRYTDIQRRAHEEFGLAE